MKLLFVYDHPKHDWWIDGLRMAMELLKKSMEVTMLNLHDLTSDARIEDFSDYDFLLGWGGFRSSVDTLIKDLPIKKGLCIGGNAFPAHGAYDVLFYETDWVREFLQLKFTGTKLVKAFGINDELFNHMDFMTPLVYDYIGVGAFAKWKRWEKFNDLKGMKIVLGEYQVNNEAESGAIVTDLIKHNTIVSNAVHPLDLANMYHWSRTLYMPSDIYGGGERVVWEARSCGLDVKIEDDNPKLKEMLQNKIKGYREYAADLQRGIEAVV